MVRLLRPGIFRLESSRLASRPPRILATHLSRRATTSSNVPRTPSKVTPEEAFGMARFTELYNMPRAWWHRAVMYGCYIQTVAAAVAVPLLVTSENTDVPMWQRIVLASGMVAWVTSTGVISVMVSQRMVLEIWLDKGSASVQLAHYDLLGRVTRREVGVCELTTAVMETWVVPTSMWRSFRVHDFRTFIALRDDERFVKGGRVQLLEEVLSGKWRAPPRS